MAQIEVYRDGAGGYRFRIKGKNGEIIANSEAYSRQEDAARGVAGLMAELVEIHNHPPVKVEFK